MSNCHASVAKFGKHLAKVVQKWPPIWPSLIRVGHFVPRCGQRLTNVDQLVAEVGDRCVRLTQTNAPGTMLHICLEYFRSVRPETGAAKRDLLSVFCAFRRRLRRPARKEVKSQPWDLNLGRFPQADHPNATRGSMFGHFFDTCSAIPQTMCARP